MLVVWGDKMLISGYWSTGAPDAIGHYSQGMKAGNLIYISGCIAINPTTNDVVAGNIEAQTEQALKNLKAIAEAGGSKLTKTLKTTVRSPFLTSVPITYWHYTQVFLTSLTEYEKVNAIYAKFFGNHKPARSTVKVAGLPKDVLIEIEAVVRCDLLIINAFGRFSDMVISL
jgi:2-iminobutanoate/2-iminopropanoate deaminase